MMLLKNPILIQSYSQIMQKDKLFTHFIASIPQKNRGCNDFSVFFHINYCVENAQNETVSIVETYGFVSFGPYAFISSRIFIDNLLKNCILIGDVSCYAKIQITHKL